MDQAFRDEMAAGYALDEPSVVIGSPMLGGEVDNDARVRVALSMLNRHGLIAGATGTGKTKTLQLLAGQLSQAGIPIFISDIKGDVSGIAAPGDAANPKVQERAASLGWTFQPAGHPAEFLSLSGALGAQVRATVHSFGPLLLGKVLDLNETQTSILALIFKYCDDNSLPLLDLEDLTTTLKFLSSDEGKPILAEYGGMSRASVGVLLRQIIVLQQAGVDAFFGEPEFEVLDLLRTTPDGHGVISVLELSDVMDQPRLFSTFMLWMLAQLYETLPEAGDLPKPKLVFFFDEAHLLFDDASEALMDQIERTARLIRSKGVGVYFVTQAPTDVPSSVLAQLGNRVQHALRAFTPRDQKAVKTAAETLRTNPKLDTEEAISDLGVGEALVSCLDAKGSPAVVERVFIAPPASRIGPITPAERGGVIGESVLKGHYEAIVDRESAYETLKGRADQRTAPSPPPRGSSRQQAPPQAPPTMTTPTTSRVPPAASDGGISDILFGSTGPRGGHREGMFESAAKSAARSVGSGLGRQILRGVLGGLFGGRR
jgi:hypothetical protein